MRIRPHTRYFETMVGFDHLAAAFNQSRRDDPRRFKALYTPTRVIKPEHILATPHEQLRATGMSNMKVAFMKDLAAKTQDGTLKFNRFARMSDDEVIAMLTQVKGIGVWTVHMFLIFSLGRLDVLPVGDLGVRRAIERLYGFDHLPNAVEIEQIA
jgi:DNA-3-methyladenine glycosylase II